MRKIKIISKKYGGRLRDTYETYLYAETDETLIFFSPPGLKYFDYRKEAEFESPDGLIEIYFKHKWFNVWHICDQHSHVNLIYSNISMPATLQGTTLEWLDLDLDYRVYMDHSVERLDEAEFETNRQRWGYPPDLVEQARLACTEVEGYLANQTYPFDHERQVELYWRIQAEWQAGTLNLNDA